MMEEPTPTARLIDSRAVLLEEDNNDKQYHDVNNPSVTNVNVVKGETQPSQCRDAFFAVLFYAHLVAMAAVSCIYGGAALNYNGGGNENGSGSGSGNHGNGNNAHNTTGGFVYMILIVGALCSALSFVSLHILTHFAKSLIQIALVGQLVVSLGLAFGSLLAGQAAGFIIGILFFATGVCYACMVWSRIPFASAILNTAISGVRKNMGVTLVTYGLLAVAFAYTIMWSIGVTGVYFTQCPPSDNSDTTNQECGINGGYMALLLLSFFWTQQVIQNTIHVSVAGTVATWWFSPPESSANAGWCSSAVTDSFVRATTLSFGSICFGSLLVAIIQTLRAIVEQMRQQDDGILVCIADCLLGCIENLVQYFNKWAYVYVGMYGYDYITAGKMVMELFRSRGWSSIVGFDLVSGALFMASVMVGLLCGICGALIRATFPSWFMELGDGGGMIVFWYVATSTVRVVFNVMADAKPLRMVGWGEGMQTMHLFMCVCQ
jgi:hypothetical protein